MANPNTTKIEDLPMPSVSEPLRTLTLDSWEVNVLSQKASADALVYAGHYLNGTAGRFSESEIEIMLRLRRLAGKFANLNVDLDPGKEERFAPSLTTLAYIREHGMDVAVETAIFEHVVRSALSLGCKLSLQDGLSAVDGAEEVVTDSTDALEIMRASRSTDADVLILRGPITGWIAFVWGNGADVIHDHSALPTISKFVDSFGDLLDSLR